MNQTMDPGEEHFFEQGEQPHFELEEEQPLLLEPPSARVRRARLRRIVAAALVASLALFGVGLLLRHSAARVGQAPGVAGLDRRVMLDALLPRALAVPVSEIAPPSAPLAPPPTPSAALGVGDPAALIRSARQLLESGHTRAGVEAARSAVAANPNDAEPYILLAAGLQDLGQWAEAQTVFSTCKQKTSSGPNATCRYFAGN
jgi:cytochrome c-type biogenesis protein CcmH/NrfG